MFLREKINIKELQSSTLKILPDRIEYNQSSNEIWVFGLTEKNQTVLIRVKTFINLFFIYTQDKKENENKSNSLKELMKKQFEKSEINVEEFKHNDQIYYKIEIFDGSFNEDMLKDHINKVEIDKLNLVGQVQQFVPKTANQFQMSLKINPKTFLSIQLDDNLNSIKEDQNEKISTCQIEILSNQFKTKISFDEKLYEQITNNQIILITDIENLVLESGFEAVKVKKNPIFMISNIIFKYGEKQKMKKIFTTSEEMELDPSVEVKYFKSELQMLITWFEELYAIDPDVISGFNVLKFDLSFLYLRTKYLIEQEKSDYKNINFGRVPSASLDGKIVEDLFENKNYFFLKEDIPILEASGRQVIDNSWYFNHTHTYVPVNQRKLKDWAQRYLNDDSQKLEISYDQFSEYLFSKDIKKRSQLGEYNMRDIEIVHNFLQMFDILNYYKEMGFLNSTLTQDYHNKSLFPFYFSKLIICSQNTLDFENDMLVIKNNQQDHWEKIQNQIQHLKKLLKVKFLINDNTSPQIFKQIITLQDKLSLENITLKYSLSNLPFSLSPLIANLDENKTKAISLYLDCDVNDSEIDLIESFTKLPPNVSYISVKLNEKVKMINYDKNLNFKANQISKIMFDFDQFQSSSADFIKFLAFFLTCQQNLTSVDLIFSYNQTNAEFIKNVIKIFCSSCKQLKTLNLTVKGNEQIKNSKQKTDKANQNQLFENILSILEKELLCIQILFFNYTEIKLTSLSKDIFSTFASNLAQLKVFSLQIDEQKSILKNSFYEMIRKLKQRQ